MDAAVVAAPLRSGSRPGGTRFSFVERQYSPGHVLCRVRDNGTARDISAQAQNIMSGPGNVASVLLLEDDWDHRTVFRNFLEHRGWLVREAAEAESARELLAREPADVIVMDLGGTN